MVKIYSNLDELTAEMEADYWFNVDWKRSQKPILVRSHYKALKRERAEITRQYREGILPGRDVLRQKGAQKV